MTFVITVKGNGWLPSLCRTTIYPITDTINETNLNQNDDAFIEECAFQDTAPENVCLCNKEFEFEGVFHNKCPYCSDLRVSTGLVQVVATRDLH